MDEREALDRLAAAIPAAGDDAAVVDDLVVTTDMLHERTDFPEGTTRDTAGWRAVGASLSDVAAMGADATAAVAAYGAPEFAADDLLRFVRGARDVCDAVGAEYVGGDLDDHGEFTVATTAVGRLDGDAEAVTRAGAEPGQAVCVTGELGRTAAALALFDRGAVERADELFRFPPRVASGGALRRRATAMLDSSDGLARSLHQLADASDCGVAVSWGALPVHPAVGDVADSEAEHRELAAHVGEDFELICAIPEEALGDARRACPADLTRIGSTVESGVTADGDPLPDRGYDHGE